MDDIFQSVVPQGVASPCVLVCMIDQATGWCLGCGRTGDEIECWSAVGDPARQAILDALPARMTLLEGRL